MVISGPALAPPEQAWTGGVAAPVSKMPRSLLCWRGGLIRTDRNFKKTAENREFLFVWKSMSSWEAAAQIRRRLLLMLPNGVGFSGGSQTVTQASPFLFLLNSRLQPEFVYPGIRCSADTLPIRKG